MVSDVPAGDGKIGNLFYSVLSAEITLEERNMEMKNSAYSQEKRASAPPPPLYDQETGRESNQGASSRDQSSQLCATTSLYQTAVIQDAQEVGVCETEYFSSFISEKCFLFCFLRYLRFSPPPPGPMTLVASINIYI